MLTWDKLLTYLKHKFIFTDTSSCVRMYAAIYSCLVASSDLFFLFAWSLFLFFEFDCNTACFLDFYSMAVGTGAFTYWSLSLFFALFLVFLFWQLLLFCARLGSFLSYIISCLPSLFVHVLADYLCCLYLFSVFCTLFAFHSRCLLYLIFHIFRSWFFVLPISPLSFLFVIYYFFLVWS